MEKLFPNIQEPEPIPGWAEKRPVIVRWVLVAGITYGISEPLVDPAVVEVNHHLPDRDYAADTTLPRFTTVVSSTSSNHVVTPATGHLSITGSQVGYRLDLGS